VFCIPNPRKRAARITYRARRSQRDARLEPWTDKRAFARFCHNLTTLEFNSSRHGMGDDAGSGTLGTGSLCAGCGERLPLFFLGKLRQ
jgi:hypothetical protein